MNLDTALPPMRGLGPVRISRDPLDGLPSYATLLDEAPVTGACPVHRREHLAIVPVARPADTLVALGWTGASNSGVDVAVLSAVLRSWEERFGATLVTLDGATLWVAVAAPPRTREECAGVAAEHVAFCPEVAGKDPQALLGAPTWRFRWTEMALCTRAERPEESSWSGEP